MQEQKEKFKLYYQEIFQKRWPALLVALEADSDRYFWTNPFCLPPIKSQLDSQPVRGENGLLSHYILDYASLVAAEALGVQAGDYVLDLCAAPGGKSLILAAHMADGSLVANELSQARRLRLTSVLKQYLPADVLSRVKVSGHDASRWGLYKKEMFDRVLADVPCSGERHLLQNHKELEAWTAKRSEKLAIRQYAILASAMMTVKVGGTVVYSTCAISPLENDGVIEKLLKRQGSQVKLLDFEHSLIEKTKYGFHILPDKTGYGPIYFSIIQKIS